MKTKASEALNMASQAHYNKFRRNSKCEKCNGKCKAYKLGFQPSDVSKVSCAVCFDTGLMPYVDHPISVSKIALDINFNLKIGLDINKVKITSLLHDVLEDSNTNPTKIKEKFGEEIYVAITELTCTKCIKYSKYISNIINSDNSLVKLVKLSDITHNLITTKEAGISKWKIELYEVVKEFLYEGLKNENKRTD